MTFPQPSRKPLVRQPLYRQVMEQVRADLQNRSAGERIPTESDYVKAFGVSTFTVRQALAELERLGAIVKRQGIGTFVAEQRPPEKHVAVLLDVEISSENLSPYYLHWLRALCELLRQEGIAHRPYLGHLPLGTFPGPRITCEHLREDVRLGRVTAIMGYFVSLQPYWGEEFLTRGIPVIDSQYGRPEMTRAAIHGVFRHFRDRQRRRIAVIGWQHPDHEVNFTDRHLAEIAPEYGIEIDRQWLSLDANGWEYGMGWERLRDIWRSSRTKPDGLYIAEERLFGDCQKALLELGISVPGQLDVALRRTAYPGIPEPQIPVFLLEKDLYAVARASVEGLKCLLKGEALPPYPEVNYTKRFVHPVRPDVSLETPHSVVP